MHKKYTYKNGKKYGPYSYETKRVNGKIITTYLGKGNNFEKEEGKRTKVEEKKVYNYSLVFLVVGVLLLAFTLFYFYPGEITGRVTFDSNLVYEQGEIISGNLNFNIKEGELIPKDSKIVINYGNQSRVLNLIDLVDGDTISGVFYAEGASLSGEGEGFGKIGTKIIYPNVNFDLLVYEKAGSGSSSGGTGSSSNSGGQNNTGSGMNSETVNNESVNGGESSGQAGTEDNENNGVGVPEQDLQQEPSNPGETEEEPETVEEQESAEQEESGGQGNTGQDTGEETEGDSSEGGESIPESEGENSNGGEEGAAPITGEVISEGEFVVEGSVNGEEEFSYNLEESQTAKIVEGSVYAEEGEEEKNLPDSSVNLEISDNKAVVSSDYSVSEEGYGEDYLGDFALTLSIDMDNFDLVANPGELEIELVYGDNLIVSHKEQISIQDSEEAVEVLINETLSNETILEESNLSLIKEIPLVRVPFGGSRTLDLNNYFLGAERYEFFASNLTAEFKGDAIKISSEEEFKGAVKGKITAHAGENSLESNSFNILVSSGAINIKTSRSKIVVGEPVKWTKNVSLETEGEKVSIIIPKAENISVKKIDSGEEREVDPRISPISGNVVSSTGNSEEINFIYWLKGLTKTITGRSVDSEEEIAEEEEVLEIILDEEDAKDYVIEYVTEEPKSVERETKNGKIVSISGPDDVEYTDVIAFTELNNNIPVSSQGKIKLYWHNYDKKDSVIKDVSEVSDEEIVENVDASTEGITEDEVENFDSFVAEEITEEENTNNSENAETESTDENVSVSPLTGQVVSEITNEEGIKSKDVESGSDFSFVKKEMPFDAYDLDGDGNLDYMEWVVPHLSNQTFEIILITEAEHLDENRAFVSDIFEEVKALDGNWSETIPSNHYVRVTFERNLTSERDITVYPRTVNGVPRIEIYEYNETELIAEFESLNDNEYNKVFLSKLEGEQDTFDLLVLGGSLEFDHIIDPVGDTNNWISSTLKTFDDPTAWSLGTVPVEGENVVFNGTATGNVNITNGTLVQNLESFLVESTYTGSLYFNALFANGSWGSSSDGTQEWNVTNNISFYGGTAFIYGDYLHKGDGTSNITDEGHGQIWRSLNGNVSVGSSAILSGVDLGFPIDVGPGTLTSNGQGVHGGTLYTGETPYGNATAPTALGSGSDNSAGASAIHLISDILLADGDLSFRASSSTADRGAGGSIWLSANEITGTGTLDASGGDSTNNGAAGGGGRIRIGYADVLGFTGRIDASSGISGTSNPASALGGDGTLTFTDNTWPGDWNVNGSFGLLGGDYGEGNVVNVLGDFSLEGGNNISVYGDCFGNSAAPLAYVCYNATEDGRGVWINASGNITIGEGSYVEGRYLGFPNDRGPAVGRSGGGHGGLGGDTSGSTFLYGDPTMPVSLGSGGDNGGAGSAVRLTSQDIIHINGTITVDGDRLSVSNDRGAGGSIWLEGSRILGKGILSAVGGSPSNNVAAGGGGRIALTSIQEVEFSGTIDASGGATSSGTYDLRGGGGTIYVNASTSVAYSGNATSIGNDGGYINVTDTFLTFSGIFNASPRSLVDGDYGNITFNYTDCSSTFTGTFAPHIYFQSPCDSSVPVVVLLAPADDLYVNSNIQSFNASFTDNINLVNSTFYLWNSTDDVINQTTSVISGTADETNLSVTLPYEGNFSWNYQAYDNSTNEGWRESNFSLIYDESEPTSIFVFPTNDSGVTVGRNYIEVNVTAIDDNLESILIRLYNSSHDLINSSLNSTTSAHHYVNFSSLLNGLYYYNATANDSAGNLGDTETRNITINTDDSFPPSITLISPSDAELIGYAGVNLTASITDNVRIDNATLYLWNSTNDLINTTSRDLSGTSASVGVNVTLPYEGAFSWNYQAYDNSTNEGWASTNFSLTLGSGVPSVNFVDPTPSGVGNYSSDSIYVNVSTTSISPHYAFVDFNRDLVLWSNFDDLNSSEDPLDLSTYGNNGSLAGDALINSTGQFGNATWFDGIGGDYVTFADTDRYTFANSTNDFPFSTSAWVYYRLGTGSGSIVSKYDDFSPFNGEWSWIVAPTAILGSGSDKIYFQLVDDGATTRIRAETVDSIPENEWIHVAVTYDGSGSETGIDIYLNGSLATVNRNIQGSYVKMTNGASPIRAGASLIDGGSSAGYLNGSLDEILIFNRTLTAEEVGALYNATVSQYENNFTGLQNGSHSITAHVMNALGFRDSEERTIVLGSEGEAALVPNVTDLTEDPADPATYSSGARYEFNATAVDDSGLVQTVLIEFDGTNYTVVNATGTNTYNFTISDLAAGSYNYYWWANDSDGNVNNTEAGSYTVNQATGNVEVYIDNSTANKTVEIGTAVTFNASVLTGDSSSTAEVYLDGTLVANQTASINSTTTSNIGSLNVTAILRASQNYTLDSQTRWIDVEDTEEPIVSLSSPADGANITFANVNLTAIITDNLELVNATLYLYNATGGLINNSATSLSGLSTASVGINVSLPYEGNFTWNYLAADTSNNLAFGSNSTFNYTEIALVPNVTDLTEDPADPATYSSGARYEFNATAVDDSGLVQTVLIEFDETNYTVFNATGTNTYNFTISDLAAGSYNYYWWANDSDGNVNNTEAGTYTVNRAVSEVNLTLNETEGNITIVQGTGIPLNGTLITGDASNPIVLFVDGDIIHNATSPIGNITTFNTLGEINVTLHYYQSENYTSSFETYFVEVTAAPDNEFPIFLDYKETPANNTAYSVNGFYELNVSVANTNGTVGLEFNGVNYTATNSTAGNGDEYNVSLPALGAGTYPYYWFGWGNGSSANYNTSIIGGNQRHYTVAKATPSGFITATSPVTFGTAAGVFASESNSGDADVTYGLFRENVSVSNPDSTVLGVGTYNYHYNSTGGQNYSAVAYLDIFDLVVNQATGNVEVYIDNSTANKTVEIGTAVTFNASVLVGDSSSTAEVYLEGSLVANQTASINLTSTSSIESLNVTAILRASQNYTSDSQTRWIDVEDTSFPEVTINFPEAITYGTNNLPLHFNVSLNQNGSVLYSLDGGLNNVSMNGNEGSGLFGTEFNHTNSSIANGTYTFSVYANDTSGNVNNTESVTFNFDAESPRVSVNSPEETIYAISVIEFNVTTDENATTALFSFSEGSVNYTMQNNGNRDFNYTNSTIPDGDHTATFFVNDSYNNLNGTETVDFTVDTIAPNVVELVPADNSVFNTSNEIEIAANVTDATSSVSAVLANVTLSNATVNQIVLSRFQSTDKYNASYTIPNLAGTYNLTIIANDSANNVNRTESISFNVSDVISPESVLVEPSNGTAVTSNLSYFTANFTDNLGLLNSSLYLWNSSGDLVRVNSTNISGISNSSNLSLYFDGEGTYLWNYLAYDIWNNSDWATSNLTIIFSFTDITSPLVTINVPEAITYTSASLAFNVSLNENGTVLYSLDDGATNVTMNGNEGGGLFGTEFNYTNSSIPEGSYTFNVYANDTTGNTNYTESVNFTVSIESASPGSGSSGGGSGGGGGAQIVQQGEEGIIELAPSEFSINVLVGEETTRELILKNKGSNSISLTLELEGLEGIIQLEETLVLSPGQEKSVNINVLSTSKGLQVGNILVKSGGKVLRKHPVVVNVRSENFLFDSAIVVSEDSRALFGGDKVRAQIDLLQVGPKEKVDVTATYVIKDFSGNIYLEESETFFVLEEKSYIKEFSTDNLPPGKYLLGMEITYPGAFATSSSQFEVKGSGFGLSRNQLYIMISGIIIFLATSVVLFLVVKSRTRLLRKKLKNYHSRGGR